MGVGAPPTGYEVGRSKQGNEYKGFHTLNFSPATPQGAPCFELCDHDIFSPFETHEARPVLILQINSQVPQVCPGSAVSPALCGHRGCNCPCPECLQSEGCADNSKHVNKYRTGAQ